jgi:uncharacterized repeat protein (TIGR02543 family)
MTGSNGYPTLYFGANTNGATGSTTPDGSASYWFFTNHFYNGVGGGWGNVIKSQNNPTYNSSTGAVAYSVFTGSSSSFTAMVANQQLFGFGTGNWGQLRFTSPSAITTFYSRTAITSTGGTVSTNGAARYALTGDFVATAAASANYRFVSWSGAGSLTNTSNPLTVPRATAFDTDLTAVFAPTRHTLTINANAANRGSVQVFNQSGTLLGTLASAASTVSIANVPENSVIRIVATPLYNYLVNSWSGVTAPDPSDFTITMPTNALTATVTFTARVSSTLNVTKENGGFGSVSVSSVNGTVNESAGSISMTAYSGVAYTLTAVVSNPSLYKFSHWSNVSPQPALRIDALSFVYTPNDSPPNTNFRANFVELPAYTIEDRVSDGKTTYNAGNPAYDAGCRIAVDTAPLFTSPNRYAEGYVSITATPAANWRVQKWNVTNAGAGGGDFVIASVNPLTFSIAYNAVVTCHFEKIPTVATASIHAASEGFGLVDVTYDGTTDDSVDAFAGSDVVFSASPDGGYGFDGWYLASGALATNGTNNPLTVTMTSDLELFAKFSATVTVNATHTAAADDTGLVSLNGGATGATKTLAVALGDSVTIRAISTTLVETPASGSQFSGWFDASDSSPLEYLAEQAFTVTDNIELDALFVGFEDLVDRYLAILNFNNNNDIYDGLLGVLSATNSVEEITGAEWATWAGDDWYHYVGATPPTGPEEDPKHRFYRFQGSVATTIRAVANGTLGFMSWKSIYLTAIEPVPETGAKFLSSDPPVTISTATQVSILTNRHYILTAVWGAPQAVTVNAKFAAGCDSSNGDFTMSPVTVDREDVLGGVSDSYMQGSSVTVSADVENGYVFAGWYYDKNATVLASLEPVFVKVIDGPVDLYAKFTQDTDAVYKWVGGTANKLLTWRSKRFLASKPFNPTSARIYADGYIDNVTLNLYMAESPDKPSPSKPTVSVLARNQNGFRLPMARPDKYLELEVTATVDVTEVTISTSMEGLAQ